MLKKIRLFFHRVKCDLLMFFDDAIYKIKNFKWLCKSNKELAEIWVAKLLTSKIYQPLTDRDDRVAERNQEIKARSKFGCDEYLCFGIHVIVRADEEFDFDDPIFTCWATKRDDLKMNLKLFEICRSELIDKLIANDDNFD